MFRLNIITLILFVIIGIISGAVLSVAYFSQGSTLTNDVLNVGTGASSIYGALKVAGILSTNSNLTVLGNVGIGTSTPTGKLVIPVKYVYTNSVTNGYSGPSCGCDKGPLSLDCPFATGYYTNFDYGIYCIDLYRSGNTRWIGAQRYINNAPNLYVSASNNNVGILTANPGESLDVAGNFQVNSNGIVTKGDWEGDIIASAFLPSDISYFGNSIEDSEISDDITLSDYFPLSGGTITGNLSLSSSTAKLDVASDIELKSGKIKLTYKTGSATCNIKTLFQNSEGTVCLEYSP